MFTPGDRVEAMDLLEELKTIVDGLDRSGIDYGLCGGLALAVYAKPRATLDIDLLIRPESLPSARDPASRLGYLFPASPMVFHGGGVRIHRFTKIDEADGEALSLGLLLVTEETEGAWEGRLDLEWEGGRIKVVAPEGLILLKTLRGSGRDRDDIEYLRSLLDED